METLLISIKRLISEEQCYETIRHLRWSDEVRCPHCDSEQIIKRVGWDEVRIPASSVLCWDSLRHPSLHTTIFWGTVWRGVCWLVKL